MNQKLLLRLIALLTVFLLMLVFLVWNAGLVALPFLTPPQAITRPAPIKDPTPTTAPHSSGPSGEETDPESAESGAATAPGQTDPGQTDPGQTSPDDTEPTQTAPPSTTPGTSRPETQPPETNAPQAFPTVEELSAQGYVMLNGSAQGGTVAFGRIEIPKEFQELASYNGTRKTQIRVRHNSGGNGLVIKIQDKYRNILSIEPYMGFVIAHLGDSACLLDNAGNLLREDFPTKCGLVYALDDQARPIIEWDLGSGKYYAINSAGGLIRIQYTPSQDLRVDYPMPSQRSDPTPYSETVPVFWLVDEAEMEKLPEGTILYTEAQKEAILGGMSPEDALIMFPANGESAPDETDPEETDPEETDPEETSPEETSAEEPAPDETDAETDTDTAPEPAPDDPQTDSGAAEAIKRGHGSAAGGDPAPQDTDTAETSPADETQGEETKPDETTSAEIEPEPEPEPDPDETASEETDPEETNPDETDPGETDPEETNPDETDPEETTPEEPEPEEPQTLYRMTYEVRYGYKNQNGDIIVPPTYIYAFPFGSNGLAAAIFWYETAKTEGLLFLNTAGKVVIDVADKAIWNFTANGTGVYDGYAPALNGDLSDLGSYWFDHGYVMVRRRTVLYRKPTQVYSDSQILIDEKGKIFELPDGYELCSYSEGVLLLKHGNTYGLMDIRGRWIAQTIYNEIIPYQQGLAIVRKGSFWGVIDLNGAFVLDMEYSAISPISRGLLSVRKDETWYLLRIMEKPA